MKRVLSFLQLAAGICFSLHVSAQNITTVTGNGQFSYGGDEGPASTAAFNGLTGIYYTAAGNLYIADANNNVVRLINSASIISTAAGNGFGAAGPGSYSGDGGQATAAELYGPQDIILDPSGNLYIADAGNHVVRKVSSSGIISTIAGNGTAGYTGDGFAATAAELSFPLGVALDTAGNLYIADTIGTIRKVNTSGIISTIAGANSHGYSGDNGPATAAIFGSPSFIITDLPGNLYISDGPNHRIRKINMATGIIRTIIGNGAPGSTGDGSPATAAEIGTPIGITIDNTGNIYFADVTENVVRKVTASVGPASGTISTIGGIAGVTGYTGDGGPATAAELNGPDGITVDGSGDIYVTIHFSKVIREISSSGIISTFAGTTDTFFCGDGGPAIHAELDSPMASAFDNSGNLYIADYANNCIRIVHPSGSIATFAGNALAPPGYSGDGGPASTATLNHPKGVATDASGNVYISDAANACIRIVHPSGTIDVFAGTPLSPGYSGDGSSALSAQLGNPNQLVVDSAGNVYFSDEANHRVRVIHPSGSIATFAGDGTPGSGGDGSAATSAQLTNPTGLAIDASGNIYIADSGAARVRIVHPSGNINTFAGTGTPGFSGDGNLATAAQLEGPTGVIVDDSGNVHIADGASARIRIVHPSGNIATYVGTGTPGFNGDGPIASAQLNFPVSLTKNTSGELYVTERSNRRVRRFAGTGGLAVKSVNQVTEDLTVYPNPNKGTFMLNFSSSNTGHVRYIITNILGQKIKEIDATIGQPFELQLSVPPGIYLLNAITNNSRKTVKVVIDP